MFRLSGGYGNDILIEDVLKIVRKLQPEDVVEFYKKTLDKCPNCGETRKVIKGKPVIPKSICKDSCLKDIVKDMLEDYKMVGLKKLVIKEFAISNKLGNGETMQLFGQGYRNQNLYFWDKINQEVEFPFTEIDDYGSVPPQFVVADGYFNPTDWLKEVEHNSIVFPARPLINELKEFYLENPKEKHCIVTINDEEYLVLNNQRDMKPKDWDSIILEVGENYTKSKDLRKYKYMLEVYPGDPKWRDVIDEEKPGNAEAKDAALLAMVAAHAKGKEGENVLGLMLPSPKSKGGNRTRKNKD